MNSTYGMRNTPVKHIKTQSQQNIYVGHFYCDQMGIDGMLISGLNMAGGWGEGFDQQNKSGYQKDVVWCKN